MNEKLYRPIDKTKDKIQKGDQFASKDNPTCWENIDVNAYSGWLEIYVYRRPIELDMDYGNYRLVEISLEKPDPEAEWWDRYNNKWRNRLYPDNVYTINDVYRVPTKKFASDIGFIIGKALSEEIIKKDVETIQKSIDSTTKPQQESTKINSDSIGKKYDSDKPRWDLADMDYFEDVVKVLGFGSKKYGDYNWELVDKARNRYFSALLRHIAAYKRGEVNDPETGLPHLAHAGCNLMFLNHFQKKAINENGPKSDN